MNPNAQAALGKLLHQMIGAPTEKMTEQAIVKIKEQIPFMKETLKKINSRKPGHEDIMGLEHFYDNIRRDKLGNMQIAVHADTFLVIAMYQVVFEVTFEQAIDKYCNMMREKMAEFRAQDKEMGHAQF